MTEHHVTGRVIRPPRRMPVGQAKDRRTMLVRFELEFGPQIGVRRTMRPGFTGIRYRRVPRVGGAGTTDR